jgi:hypothetical protein
LAAANLFIFVMLIGLAALPGIAQDQIADVYSNQQVRMSDLPLVTATSDSKSAGLAAALETMLHDPAVCCGKDSALRDQIFSGPSSLRGLSVKLQGKYVLGDGQTVW